MRVIYGMLGLCVVGCQPVEDSSQPAADDAAESTCGVYNEAIKSPYASCVRKQVNDGVTVGFVTYDLDGNVLREVEVANGQDTWVAEYAYQGRELVEYSHFSPPKLAPDAVGIITLDNRQRIAEESLTSGSSSHSLTATVDECRPLQLQKARTDERAPVLTEELTWTYSDHGHLEEYLRLDTITDDVLDSYVYETDEHGQVTHYVGDLFASAEQVEVTHEWKTGHSVMWKYTKHTDEGRLTTDYRITQTFDDAGRKLTWRIQDFVGVTEGKTTWEYDASGRLIKSQSYDEDGAYTARDEFTYTHCDN